MNSAGFGGLLKNLRTVRRVSQLKLSLDAEVSTRHLSFLETGRANPSREMVLLLGSALELSLRERNLLLEAAGFTPAYRETPLDAPEMAELRQALELILRAHEPLPAVVLDRHWNVTMSNGGFAQLAAMLDPSQPLEPYALLEQARRPNLLRALAFTMRPLIRNWEELMADLLPRLEREPGADDTLRALLEQLRALPGVDPRRTLQRARLVVPVELAVGDHTARLFSTITTLGTAQDITTQELRIEAFHAADAESRALLRQVLGQL